MLNFFTHLVYSVIKIPGEYSITFNMGRGPCQSLGSKIFTLKGQGHLTVNKHVISGIYIVDHMWPLCSARILVDGVNPQ